MYACMDVLEAHAESGMHPCGCSGTLAALCCPAFRFAKVTMDGL